MTTREEFVKAVEDALARAYHHGEIDGYVDASGKPQDLPQAVAERVAEDARSRLLSFADRLPSE